MLREHFSKVAVSGIEPESQAYEAYALNHLDHTAISTEKLIAGIEPARLSYQESKLPLQHMSINIRKMVRVGFEPTTH